MSRPAKDGHLEHGATSRFVVDGHQPTLIRNGRDLRGPDAQIVMKRAISNISSRSGS